MAKKFEQKKHELASKAKMGKEIRKGNLSGTERAHAKGNSEATKALHGMRTPKKLEVKHKGRDMYFERSVKRGIGALHAR